MGSIFSSVPLPYIPYATTTGVNVGYTMTNAAAAGATYAAGVAAKTVTSITDFFPLILGGIVVLLLGLAAFKK
jgi:hypothetical protein